MSFKIKDSLQIGTVVVANNSGIIQDAALSNVVTGGTYTSVTVDAKGRVTAGSAPGISETDTLASVTARGATTSVAVSITNATASTTTATGSLVLSGGLGVAGAIWAGSVQGTPVGSTTRSTGAFTSLDANAAVGLSPASAAVTISPTGTGTVAISPAGALTVNPTAASTINNCSIGATTRSTGGFTSLDANSTVGLSPANANVTISPTGTGTVTISPVSTVAISPTGVLTVNPTAASTINNCSIGATTAAAGKFTTLDASNTVTLSPASANITISPTGTGTVTISPAGAFTVNPTAASTINNCSIGASTRSTGAFTTLDANNAVGLSPANQAVTISPTGTGTVAISPAGALTVNPTATSTINNCSIGASTRGSGAFTSLAANGAVTMTVNTSSTTTGTGTLVVTGGVGIGENLNVGGNTILTGNLTVNGTTTTINSTTQTIIDPIFNMGGGMGGAAPTSDDAKDRGIAFQWWDTAARVGFFGFDRSTGYFTFIPLATNTSEVMSGSAGDMQATNFRGALVGNADTATKLAATKTIAITGDLAYTSGGFDGSGNVTGTGTLATVNSNVSGPYNSVTVNAKGLVTAASTVAYLTAEADTLATVTARSNGTFTTTDIQVNGSSFALAPVTTAKVWIKSLAPTSININTAAVIDTFLIATYRSAKYSIQIVQGSKYQISDVTVIHDNTTCYITEYAVVETSGGTPIPVTFSAAIVTTTLTVSATITDGAGTPAALLIQRTIFSV